MVTPSPAEVTRTLLSGRLPALLRVGERSRPDPVHHATDQAGRPLVLIHDGDPLSRWLSDREHDLPVTLSVEDVLPVAGAPSLGCARVFGRPRILAPDEVAAAVDQFAESNPVAGLLDVGRGAAMYVVDVARLELAHRSATDEIDLTGYAAAEPDPLHELERDLLVDLADHHAPQVESYFRFLLAMAGVPCCAQPPRAVRLDRYGFVVDIGGAHPWTRLNFHRPVRCHHELAHLLHPVLCRRRAAA